jgi:hypothetical protein
MRRFAVLGAVALAVSVPVAVSHAARTGATDGCLVVSNSNAIVTINARGTIVGRFDNGQVTITDPTPGDGTVKVSGYDEIVPLTPPATGGTKKRYTGQQNVRFRASGKTIVRVEAIGIDLSAVGRGKGTLNGGVFIDPGTYSIDSDSFCQDKFHLLPETPQTFVLGSTS